MVEVESIAKMERNLVTKMRKPQARRVKQLV
jgi:hypothetical protein